MELPKEDILQHIFLNRLYKTTNLKTTDGDDLQILKTGTKNFNSGPDFLNSLIKINDTQLAGNIEIHVKASDWLKHNHQTDLAYNNVILHVVLEADMEISVNQKPLPTLVLKGIVNENIFENHESLLQAKTFVPCQKSIANVPSIITHSWFDRMLAERIEDKALMVNEIMQNTNNSWEETFYQMLGYTFGFGLNKHTFLKTAQSLPLQIIAKHKNNITQIEALLFGTAGLLNDYFADDYPKTLQNEYNFLKTKYQLKQFVRKQEWHFSKMHPTNFPSIRLAQFAQLIFTSSHLFSKILECKNITEIEKLFAASVSEYWKTHYVFDTKSVAKNKNLGATSLQLIIINTVVPVLYSYSKTNAKYRELALEYLQNIAPERNGIIKNWKATGVEVNNAYTSQALLHLKNNYCNNKLCLKCAVGGYLVKH